jgi:hypothetical protein
MFFNIKSLLIGIVLASLCLNCLGQETGSNTTVAQETASAQEAHTIILSPGRSKPPAFLYAVSAQAQVLVGMKQVEQGIQLQIRIVQGDNHKIETVSLGLGGIGDVIDVQGESIASWAVRTADSQRYLDLQIKPTASDPANSGKAADKTATIRILSEHTELPTKVELAHLMPGKALGFDSQIQIQYVPGVAGKIVAADGFAPLVSSKRIDRLQTATGGRLELRLDRNSALPPAVVGQRGDQSVANKFRLSARVIKLRFRPSF